MFNATTPITVGESTYNYGLVSVIDGKSNRVNQATNLSAPDTFTLSHETKGKGINTVDRHLARIDTTVTAVADGVTATSIVSAYVVVVMPRIAATNTDAKLALDKVVTFLGATESGAVTTNLNRFLNGEP